MNQRVFVTFQRTVGIAAVYLTTAGSFAFADQRRVVIATDGTQFKVVSQSVSKQDPPKIHRLTFSEGAYYVEGKDAQGNVVNVQSLPDPARIYYDYADRPSRTSATGPEPVALSGGDVANPHPELVVQLPVNDAVTKLQIYRQKISPVQNAARASSASISAVAEEPLHIVSPLDPETDLPISLPSDLILEPTATLDLGQVEIGGQQ